MHAIIYRGIKKEDYPRLLNLINEAFGFEDFIKSSDFLEDVLMIYLQECIMASNYSQVAVCDGEIIGIILGSAKSDSRHLKKMHNYLSYARTMIKLLWTSGEDKQALKEFSKITTTYKELLKGKELQFDGCLQLFIVSKEAQGKGVGKQLLHRLFTYLKQMKVKSLYLYTNTRCNYGFYEHQQFKRLNSKSLEFKSYNFTLDVFLYGYEF